MRMWLALGILILLAATSSAAAQVAGGYGDYVDWEGWARVESQERWGLASSWSRSGGSADYNNYEYPPGHLEGDLDVTAATITGPGIIYRFWMPHYTATRPFAIRMYFDGEATPRIETDSGQILGGTFSYFTDPLVTTCAGGQVCYEPIAFRDSVRIDTENREGLWHFYQYSYMTFPPGTDLESWDGTLEAEAQAARLATIAMFENVGQHPAGESGSAVRSVVGPTSVPGGGTLTLADLVGPGLIRRLNVRMDDATDEELDSLRLQVFYDADSLQSIDVPVGWFFGAGDDRAPYRSLPMGTDSPDGFYCYWPMPFHGAVRVELVNPMPGPIPIDSTVVEYDLGHLSTNMGYLHAVARDTIRYSGMMRYTMAEICGTGHYVGNFLFLEQDDESMFMLEGDDILIVDDVTINGTGLEDAYNGGYYYNWVQIMPEPEGPRPPFAFRPLHGILRVNQTESPPFARADQYRWMIGDRVSFTRSLEVNFESFYSLPGARWKSVVFWYELPTTIFPTGAPSPNDVGHRERGLELRSIAPNPTTDAIVIRFALPADESVPIDLLDVAGRRVVTMSDGPRPAGDHEVRWSLGRLPNGVYFVRLRAGDLSEVRKLVLVR